jgi:mono/diheme cytochrome c family protein
MPLLTRKSLLSVGILSGVAIAAVGGFVWSGLYNIGADDQHTKLVYATLETLRERSIQARTRDLVVPDLADAALIRQGAGNYDAMCTGCHLAPGMEATELSRGLYPAPPAFAVAGKGDAAHHFWVIKHGIKASGMPAWGKSMDDRYVWGLVALVQQLPDLDAAQYRALVASSGGHSHGGGETPAHHHDEAMGEHHHDEAMPEHHHDEATHDEPAPIDESKPHTHPPGTSPHAPAAEAAAPKTMTHVHADGTVETHPVEEAPTHDDSTEHHHDH